MRAIGASATPVSAPFQPAWAAATTRASGSASRIGAQSAASAPQITPAWRSTTRRPAAGRRPGPVGDEGGGGVDLVGGDQLAAEVGGGAAAVLAHGAGSSFGADADVQAGVEALG
jgi:hypothetical protein